MRYAILMAAVAALLAGSSQIAHAQVGPLPPGTWELFQNDPDPFCSGTGATSIDFSVPVSAHVELVVLQSDVVVRTLVDAALVAGHFRVVWDGNDTQGSHVPDGAYPYRMTARDAKSNVLFQDTKTATVLCNVGVQTSLWGTLKCRYR